MNKKNSVDDFKTSFNDEDVEMYSDERINEFLNEDRLTPQAKIKD